MKRNFLKIWVVTIFCMSLGGLCFAHSMTSAEFVLGGIGFNCTMGYVQEIYGEPTSKEFFRGDGVRTVKYMYGDNFKIVGLEDIRYKGEEENMHVHTVVSRAGNLSTPSGIAVGMKYSEVVGLFGLGKGITMYRPLDDCVYYAYVAGAEEMDIGVDSAGIIREIIIGRDV